MSPSKDGDRAPSTPRPRWLPTAATSLGGLAVLVMCGAGAAAASGPHGSEATHPSQAAAAEATLCNLVQYETYPQQFGPAPRPALRAHDYVGLTQAEAEARAGAEHAELRIVEINGVCQGYDTGSLSNRVTVSIDHGKVVAASIS